MKHALQSFGLSLFIVLAFIVIGIGFLFGLDNPVPWIMIAILVILPFVHNRMTRKHFVTWEERFSVGIPSIDEDHKKLMSLINNLQSAILYPTDEAFERQALQELVDYTQYHFQREERLMQENGYPDFEAHKQQHQKMIARVQDFLAAYERDREGTVQEMTDFLKDWLIRHIAGTDQQYSAFLKEKGVQ